MKIYISLLLTIFLLIILVKSSSALTCNLRSNSCAAGETCLFSTYQQNNSHVGNCTEYTYKVCCDTVISATNRTSCNADEDTVISMYATANSHAANKTSYNNKICAKYAGSPINASVKASCAADETCVASIFSTTNAHVGECGYYSNQICMRKLPDLKVNQSSINKNVSSPVVGDPVLFNITVWNIGDAAAPQVNVSCYDNGTYFSSGVINSIPPDVSQQTPRYASCTWTSVCGVGHNISARADPANDIQEYNETNNEAWQTLSLIEKLNIAIDSPTNGSSVYRGQTVSLLSTVTASCVAPTGYTVTWYNRTGQIATGEDTSWTIPLADSILGTQQINATANKTGYASNSTNVTITILNNLPTLTTLSYNVTPAEIIAGNGIRVSCDVTDAEDTAASLSVNISVRDPSSVWSNVSASRIGNTFYRDFATTVDSTLGSYTTVCSANDTDNGYNESATSQFLVYQNATLLLTLNSTEVWWEDGVNASIEARRADQTVINSGDITIKRDGVTLCSGTTNSQGKYSCSFTAPATVGTYNISANVTDPLTNKNFFNSTALKVKISYGGTATELERSREVGCYEVPTIIQNPDGSIKKVMVSVCALK